MYWDGLIFVEEHSWNSHKALAYMKNKGKKCVKEESSLYLLNVAKQTWLLTWVVQANNAAPHLPLPLGQEMVSW